jgi:hypothetical protein
MKDYCRRFARLALAAGVLVSSAFGADFQVVASNDLKVESISMDELRRIMLLSKSTLSDGTRVTPVLLKAGAAHEAFLKACVGKTGQEMSSYVKSLVFTGKAAAPREFATDAEVISFAAMSKGVLGYVSGSAIPMGVKKIEVR